MMICDIDAFEVAICVTFESRGVLRLKARLLITQTSRVSLKSTFEEDVAKRRK